jgi:hypothetical protein
VGNAVDGVYGYGNGIVVSPDAAFMGNGGGAAVILPRSGPPVLVDVEQSATVDLEPPVYLQPSGWIRTPEGSTAFVVTVYQQIGSQSADFVVALDGTVTAARTSVPSVWREAFTTVDGDRYVNDAGGAYRIAPDATSQRVSTGSIIAASSDHILVRECDDARSCGYTVIATGESVDEPRLIDEPVVADQLLDIFGGQLSPDGSTLAYNANDGSPALLDLERGPVALTELQPSYGDWLWAPDSSGVFRFEFDSSGMDFVERLSGETVHFGDELGPITGIAVRYPESELVTERVAVNKLSFSVAPSGPIGIDLVAIGRLGGMSLLDMDDATISTWNAPAVTGRPPRMFSDGQRVLVVAANGNSAYTATFGTGQSVAEGAIPQVPVFRGPADDQVWARNPAGAAAIDYLALDAFTGSPSGAVLALGSGTILGSDSAGGLVLSSGGDIYTWSGGAVTKLTSGELVAIGPTVAYVRECDGQLACTLLRVERSSGDRAPVESKTAIVFATGIGAPRDVSLDGSVSPDGDVVLVEYPGIAGEPSNWALFDLRSGLSALIPPPLEGQPVFWNADSTYATLAVEGAIILFERASATTIVVEGIEGTRGIAAVDATFADVVAP